MLLHAPDMQGRPVITYGQHRVCFLHSFDIHAAVMMQVAHCRTGRNCSSSACFLRCISLLAVLCMASHRQEDKLGALLHVVTEVIPGGQPTIVFASTRHHVELLAQVLRADGVASAHVYGTMDQVGASASFHREAINHASISISKCIFQVPQ